MKKPLGTASISCECRECQQVDCVSGLGFGGSLTSIKMSLWSKTPRRIFARVMPHMMTRAPTMKPWDHASRVSFAGSDGFVCSATPVSAISTALGDACLPWMWKEKATQQASCRRAVEETVKAGVLCVGRPLHAAAWKPWKDTDGSQSGG